MAVKHDRLYCPVPWVRALRQRRGRCTLQAPRRHRELPGEEGRHCTGTAGPEQLCGSLPATGMQTHHFNTSTSHPWWLALATDGKRVFMVDSKKAALGIPPPLGGYRCPPNSWKSSKEEIRPPPPWPRRLSLASRTLPDALPADPAKPTEPGLGEPAPQTQPT